MLTARSVFLTVILPGRLSGSQLPWSYGQEAFLIHGRAPQAYERPDYS